VRDLILRPAAACLGRRLTGLRDDGGRGAVAVLVAILIGAGVLFGMAALVVDVGQIYENRAELQNGADAGALAVAKSCAQGTCAPSIAAQYATANASRLTGGKAYVNFVCGATGVNGTVAVGSGTCPTAKNACPANPPAGANYVDVETSTLLPNGSHLLPPVFAGTLAGHYSGSTVFACAQAEWGGPATSATAGFTISACDWDGATGVGASFAPQPPYPTGAGPYPSYQPYDHLIFLKGGPTGGCTTELPAQNDSPGNFGWTDDLAMNCTTVVKSRTYGGSTGNSPDQYCKDPTKGLPYWQANRKVLAVPVYASIANPGSNAVYTLKGFAAFVITGINLPGGQDMQVADWVTGSVPNCGNGNSCISGFFTHELVSTTGSFGGVNLGATMMKLTG
jgi:Flp pilus assembly protein TadG